MINNPVRKQLPTLENPGTAIDLRSGKSLIAPDGSVVTGTLPEVEQATPAISVSSGGLITASAVPGRRHRRRRHKERHAAARYARGNNDNPRHRR